MSSVSISLQGGLDKEDTVVSLTAYVTVALLEAAVGEHSDITPRLRRALMCLIRTPSSDLYTMAIKSYALALADLPQARNLITKLLTINDGRPLFLREEMIGPGTVVISVYLVNPNYISYLKLGKCISPDAILYTGSNPKASAMAVEGVAYVVLAMMTIDPAMYRERAASLVKWIAQQRNGRGGFVTTQVRL